MIPAAASSTSFMADHSHEGGLLGREFRHDRLSDVESVNINLLVIVWLETRQERSGQEARDQAEGVAGEAGLESKPRLDHAGPKIGRRAERAPRDVETRPKRQTQEIEEEGQGGANTEAPAGRRREKDARPRRSKGD